MSIVNATSASRDDVLTAYNAASAGDTVMLPESDSATWSSAIEISKAITIGGNGSTLNAGAALANGFFYLNFSEATTLMRITGFTFDREDYYTTGRSLHIDGVFGNLRIDNNIFNYGTYQIEIFAPTGLIDNNTFYNAPVFVQFNGRSRAEQDAAWADLSMGTANAIFFEDNLIVCDANDTHSVGATGNGIDGSQGARVVVRYNEWDYDDHVLASQVSTLGFHGSAAGGDPYGYWQKSGSTARRSPTCLEIYENNMHGRRMDFMCTLRGGAALIYNNSIDNASARIMLREEEQYVTSNWPISRTAWPAEDQVHNTFIWDNTFDGNPQTDARVEVEAQSTDYIQKDRDYFNHRPATIGEGMTLGKETFTGSNGASSTYPTDGDTYATEGTMEFTAAVENAYYGYTPYTYPHPLRPGARMVMVFR